MRLAHHLIKDIAQKLAPAYGDSAIQEQTAWWMLAAITAKNELELITNPVELTDYQEKTLYSWIEQHVAQHKPLQYLIGSVPFGQLEILVEPPTLIPRPETEEWCLDLLAVLKKEEQRKLRILDIGTGTGCIALALAHGLPESTVYASDISTKALSLAQKNASHNKITNVNFIHSDIFANLQDAAPFDLIVTNPPYIPEHEWLTLEPCVRNWEDKQALVAPQEGLEIIEKIVHNTRHLLNLANTISHIPHLVIEIGYNQGKHACDIFKNAAFTHILLKQDLSGKDRVIMGRII